MSKRPTVAKTNAITLAEARRIALVAQGFGERHPARVDRRTLQRVFDRAGLIQIDSVNVLVRSHYLPPFSRLGSYDPTLLDAAAYDPKRRTLFEYWGHEASLIPLALYPHLRWRMARAERGVGMWGSVAALRGQRRYVDSVLKEVADRGPLSASDLQQAGRRGDSWWGWSDGKRALEYLFWSGQITTAFRRRFERVYDLSERVIPLAIRQLPTPPEEEAQRELVRIASRALAIATASDLRDYFRLDLADARARIGELVESGDLVPVSVENWKQPAYLCRGAKLPRRIEAQALLSPFDSLVWERSRTHRLFDFHFRLEIYTPAHKRVHGYYVLPFLLGDRLVARVDLKSDRVVRTLRLVAVHFEPGIERVDVARALRCELASLAVWLGLERVDAPMLRRTGTQRSTRWAGRFP